MRTDGTLSSLRSLKVRFALAGALLVLASVALTLIFVLREVGRSTEQVVLDSQEDDARRLAAAISLRLVGLQRALRSAALQLPPDALGDLPRLGEFMRAQPVLGTMFSSVFVVAADGEMLLIDDDKGLREPHLNVADRDYFKETLRERRPIVSRAAMSRATGEPFVVLTMPVFGSDGRVAGVFAGSLRMSSRSPFADLTQGGEDRHSMVVTVVLDARGQILS
nr:cache domain-containing protein [Caldimonas sp.]